MAKRTKQLSAEILTIEDSQGNPRAMLTTDPRTGMAGIHLLDESGDRLVIGLGPNGSPGISLLYPDGRSAIAVGVNPSTGTVIRINHQTGASALLIRLSINGEIEVELRDSEGNSLWNLGDALRKPPST